MVFATTAAIAGKAKEIGMGVEWDIKKVMEIAEEQDVVINAVMDKVEVIAAAKEMGISTDTDKGIKTPLHND